MIKYKLICKKCKNSFDSWFSTSKEYEKLKKLKFINCHNCGSLKVEKTLMSPSILNLKKIKVKNEKNFNIKNKIKEYQKFIKNNFKYVGENFAHEARLVHYEDKKKSKGIYGNATTEEIKELKDEGIKTEFIPWVKDDDN
tara:strand:+ start:1456 stop:1875 length:420 start_codon:yes stop_codon:yes gene_type:complete